MRLFSAIAASVFALAAAQSANAQDVTRQSGYRGVLTDFDFSGQDLSDAVFMGNFTRADFSRADLSDARLEGYFTNGNFVGTDLYNARLSGANFRGSLFVGADLDDAIIRNCNFARASLSDVTMSDAKVLNSDFTHANMPGIDAWSTSFRAVDISWSNWEASDLSDSRWEGATAKHANLAGADLTDAVFIDVDFSNANFTHADFDDVVFAHVTLAGANLSDAKNLSPEVLSGACGDANTLLPNGFSLSPCQPGDIDVPAPPRPVEIVVHTSQGVPFFQSGVEPATFAELMSARADIAAAQSELEIAIELAHQDLDPGVRSVLELVHEALQDAQIEVAEGQQLHVSVDDALFAARDALAEAVDASDPELEDAIFAVLMKLEALEQVERMGFERIELLQDPSVLAGIEVADPLGLRMGIETAVSVMGASALASDEAAPNDATGQGQSQANAAQGYGLIFSYGQAEEGDDEEADNADNAGNDEGEEE